jgi:DNA-binding response OmpR family regulator
MQIKTSCRSPCRSHDGLKAYLVNGAVGPSLGRPLRVLVADDDLDTTNSLCQLVSWWGHEARGAHDGKAALRLALAYRPDVLLLDIAMPGMSGYDLARRLREASAFEEALLVAITGYADEGHRLMGAAAGFDQYLVKPVEPAAVETLLRLERDRLAGWLGNGPRPGYRIE